MATPRQIASSRAARGGAAFEQRLRARHEVARAARYADVQHVAVPTRKIRGELRFVARTGADYIGRWGPKAGADLAGRGFIAEAKRTAERSASLAVGKRGLRPHQMAYLIHSWETWGEPAFLLWLNGDRLGVMPGPTLAAHRLASKLPWSAFEDVTEWWERPFGWLEWAAEWIRTNGPATGEEAA